MAGAEAAEACVSEGWLWRRAGHWLFEHRYWARLEQQARLVFYTAPRGGPE